MPDPVPTVSLTTTKTTTTSQPPEIEAKVIWKQKRFWFYVIALVAQVVLLVIVGGATWPQALADEKTGALITTILTMLGVNGQLLSAWKGAKRTVMTSAEEVASRPAVVERVEERAVVEVPVTTDPPKPLGGPQPRARGFVGVELLAWLLVAAAGLGGAFLSGCGTLGQRRVSGTDAEVEIWKGPPCRIIGRLDGQQVMQIDATEPCDNPEYKADPAPAPTPEGQPQARSGTMGDWTITIKGTGPHGNEDNPGDADRLAKRFVDDLKRGNQRVTRATISYDGKPGEDLLGKQGETVSAASQAAIADRSLAPSNPTPGVLPGTPSHPVDGIGRVNAPDEPVADGESTDTGKRA